MPDTLSNGTPEESVPAAIISIPVSDDRAQSFEAFKAKLRNAGLYQPASNDTAASHDDMTLLRFLRARRYDVDKAQKQFSDTEAWRKQHNVDELFRTFEANEMESARRFYPRWTGRRDKAGLPVYVYRLASLDAPLRKELESVPSDRRYQRIVVLYEAMTRFVLPLCSHLAAPTPVSSVTTIIDLEQVSLSTMWSLRSHLQVASTMATANYPETLSTIAIVNSPSFFPTIWNWIKTWFDEGTRNKIHILGKDPGPTLRLLIDERDIPQSYGGQLPWKFEDDPDLDDAIRKAIDEMPKGPVLFVDGSTVKILG
ncbi:CRAL/TRIO domain-containing protein [Suillus fuscotomentosus]|uniref:CRAL/TRIO domain-containing protein n=1 Tax=Suillus fuscotomentosus TaxID=1912939 RepID=A0AAD4E4K6_9AGAM|nr:CRAL/TRIO domain-containing protein [Suillus fuscotomentosus]KAG1898203.1 CRAL/TRIO domain-containing protein [Suillus fuscotomentosus]